MRNQHRTRSRRGLPAALELAGILLLLPHRAPAQNYTVPSYEFGSVGVDYPADANHDYSLQGIGGQTFATVDPPTNANQNLVFGGFFETGVKFVYKGSVTLLQFSGDISTIPMTAALHNTDGDVADQVSGFADATGKFAIMSWLNPTFSSKMSLKGSHFLRQLVTITPPATALDYPTATFSLKNGDVNNDNKVNISDLGVLADSFNKSQGQAGFNPNADLNGDTKVTILDLGILADNFNKSGDL